jgi:[acyl-carrier-protein] S-malonyltransferase
MPSDADVLAVLFPGQGVDPAADRGLVAELRPDLLELAGELTADDPFARAAGATRFAQPAIYCAQLARFDALGRPTGSLHAGHSLGELAALAAAGAIDDLDGLRLAATRGRLMDEAATAAEPGGMLAVGCGREQALELVAATGLALANENSPVQSVLSGAAAGLDRAAALARERGLRAKRLAVGGAFHSPDMQPTVAPFRAALAEVEFHLTEIPVISGVTATAFGADPRERLTEALVSPVRWVDVLRRLRADGARRFLDVGPGRVLGGLVKRTLDGVEVVSSQEIAHA